jgi:integrase/recombinase XerD
LLWLRNPRCSEPFVWPTRALFNANCVCRVIPIGERAIAWIEKYLNEVRAHLVIEPDDGTVFLTSTGEPFHPNHLSAMARSYVEQAQIGKGGACHLLRHTAATLMLEGGADIRFIQQMLGRDRLASTQIYTHVSVRMLKQIHAATHPAAHLKNGNGQKPIVPQEEPWPGDPTKEELLAALAEEAAEERTENRLTRYRITTYFYRRKKTEKSS